jgi:hypothetical protein
VHTSTPTRELSTPKGVKQQPLRNMNVNFLSIKTKQHLLENIIRSTYPDTDKTLNWFVVLKTMEKQNDV